MKRALVTALVVFVLAAVTSLSLFASDERTDLGYGGDRAAAHPVAVEPADNVPTMAPGTKVHATSAGKAKRVVLEVPPVGVLQDLIRAEFARFGPVVAEQAVRVAGCESTGDETGERIDPNATGSQGEVGMFQLHPDYQAARAAKFGWVMTDLYDPAKNVAVAADLYAESGWSQWTCEYAA